MPASAALEMLEWIPRQTLKISHHSIPSDTIGHEWETAHCAGQLKVAPGSPSSSAPAGRPLSESPLEDRSGPTRVCSALTGHPSSLISSLRVVTFPFSCDPLSHLPAQSIIDLACVRLDY